MEFRPDHGTFAKHGTFAMRQLALALLLAGAGALGGCATDSQATRTIGGAVLGAGAGAGIGALAGGAHGAAVGAAVGGVSGAAIGFATTPYNCLYRHIDGTVFQARCP
jgi:hypothetical protein